MLPRRRSTRAEGSGEVVRNLNGCILNSGHVVSSEIFDGGSSRDLYGPVELPRVETASIKGFSGVIITFSSLSMYGIAHERDRLTNVQHQKHCSALLS